MLDVAFISDLHLGHKSIANIRGFENVDEYNEEVIRRWNSVCGKKTMIILAGDITMEDKRYYALLNRMLGRKICIGGNHDLRADTAELLKYVESIVGCMKYKGYMVTHIPIHTQEVSRFKGNIHGHTHAESIIKSSLSYNSDVRSDRPYTVKVSDTNDKRYMNISWDALEGVPIGLNQLIEKYK